MKARPRRTESQIKTISPKANTLSFASNTTPAKTLWCSGLLRVYRSYRGRKEKMDTSGAHQGILGLYTGEQGSCQPSGARNARPYPPEVTLQMGMWGAVKVCSGTEQARSGRHFSGEYYPLSHL